MFCLLGCAGGAEPGHPPFYTDKSDLMVYLDDSGEMRAVRSREDWATRRSHILQNMQLVMGPIGDASRKTPLDMQVIAEEPQPAYLRLKISFAAESGDRVPAYLLIPNSLEGKVPAMLCLHQTVKIGKAEPVGLGGNENLRYARELAERGYVALAPDYPGYGDYAIDVYAMGYASATAKGIWNHMRAIDLLQSLPEVDAERIGCIGHSLGGHNTLYVGVFDERIKVMATSCGFNSFYKYYGGDLSGWSHKGYMPRIAERYEKDPARMPFDFTEVIAALAPRPVFVNAPLRDANFEVSGVYDCLNAARPVYALFGAADALVARHPDCEHDFPPEVREAAYEFIDRALKSVGNHR
jgi:dienelactone hydrolase